ncbi:MAG: RodZ domain-containing protein [Alphaproteobacteria bacterium]
MSDDSGSALDPDKIPKRRGLHIRDIKEEAPEPEQTVGNELRAAREAAGKELNEVAAALRIKPEHLTALEAAEYDKLPAKTYVVGFVRQYAQQLGLNASELVERLKVELEGPQPEEEPPAGGKPGKPDAPAKPAGPAATGLAGRPTSPAGVGPRRSMTPIIIAILVLLAVFGGWYLSRGSGGGNTTADKEPETGSTAAPAVPEESDGEGGQRMPDPPVIPATAENAAGAGDGVARNGGSLAALLPGAGRLGGTAGTEGEAPRLNMPDAAAMAVPIENPVEENPVEEPASRTADAAPEDVLDSAMPQPNLALRTTRDHVSGVPEGPEGGAGESGSGEPALEDIEADGVGGAARTEGAAPQSGEEAPETAEAPSGNAPPEPEPAETAEERAADGADRGQSRVTLRVRSSTWVRVEDADGRVIMERDMRSGDSFRAPETKGLYLVTKDAGAIELVLDGESIGRAGRPKQVLTGLLLAPDQLRQRVAQNTAPEFR